MATRKKKKESEWFLYGTYHDIPSVQEARHDCAHMDFHTRIIKIPATRSSKQYWELHIKYGPRLTHPRCCIEKKHWRVDSSQDRSTFIPPEEALRFKKKWMRIA